MKYLLFILVIFFISCKKEKSCENCIGSDISNNATVFYAGPIESDGCGWLIKIDAMTLYHPEILDTAFQHDQLPVKITYRLTSDKFICGIAAMEIPVIHVINIKP